MGFGIQTCLNSHEAPAKSLADKTAALAAEHGKTFAKNVMSSFSVSAGNVAWFANLGVRFHSQRLSTPWVPLDQDLFVLWGSLLLWYPS